MALKQVLAILLLATAQAQLPSDCGNTRSGCPCGLMFDPSRGLYCQFHGPQCTIPCPWLVSVTATPVSVIEKLVCEAAEQKWIEDKATDAICSMITKKLPIPDCQATLEKIWDGVTSMCPKGRETMVAQDSSSANVQGGQLSLTTQPGKAENQTAIMQTSKCDSCYKHQGDLNGCIACEYCWWSSYDSACLPLQKPCPACHHCSSLDPKCDPAKEKCQSCSSDDMCTWHRSVPSDTPSGYLWACVPTESKNQTAKAFDIIV